MQTVELLHFYFNMLQNYSKDITHTDILNLIPPTVYIHEQRKLDLQIAKSFRIFITLSAFFNINPIKTKTK